MRMPQSSAVMLLPPGVTCARGTRRAGPSGGFHGEHGEPRVESRAIGPKTLHAARRPQRTWPDPSRLGTTEVRQSRPRVSRRELVRTAALLSGSLATTGLRRVARGQEPSGPPSKLGAQLIGTLEGPALILDPRQWPKRFHEAPMLAELVRAGKLPPVEERVPREPLVIKPVHRSGATAGHGGVASPALATARTGTASSPPTSSCSGSTRQALLMSPSPQNLCPRPRKGWGREYEGVRRHQDAWFGLPPEEQELVGGDNAAPFSPSPGPVKPRRPCPAVAPDGVSESFEMTSGSRGTRSSTGGTPRRNHSQASAARGTASAAPGRVPE